jgi:hypothetical protein
MNSIYANASLTEFDKSISPQKSVKKVIRFFNKADKAF